jgi:hypothetical protein
MLAGTASADAVKVTWENDHGGNGDAVGTTQWSVPAGIPLQPGLQTITVKARDAAGNVGQAQLAVTYDMGVPVLPTPTGLRIVDSGPSADGMASFAVSWDPVPNAVAYPWNCGFNDGSGTQLTGSSPNPSFTLKLPYHADGLASSAWFCVKAQDAAGVASDAACDSFMVPVKPSMPVPPTAVPAPKATSQSLSVAFTGTPPDTSGGWSMQLYEGTTPLSTKDSSPPFTRTISFKPGTHVVTAVWTKSGVSKTSDPVTVVCPS